MSLSGQWVRLVVIVLVLALAVFLCAICMWTLPAESNQSTCGEALELRPVIYCNEITCGLRIE
jgi:hypothetical protein